MPFCLCARVSSARIEGKSLGALREKVRTQFVGVQLNAWKLWPMASAVNYAFVPPQLRVLFMNCVGFAWSTFLIYSIKNKKNLGGEAKKCEDEAATNDNSSKED